jgi:predicted DNA-binding transcriptional regulator AlpA
MASGNKKEQRGVSDASAAGACPTAAMPMAPAVSPPAKRQTYPPHPPALLTTDMILYYFVPVTDRTLDRWISADQFPRPDVKNGRRFWLRETVERWVAEQAGKAVA